MIVHDSNHLTTPDPVGPPAIPARKRVPRAPCMPATHRHFAGASGGRWPTEEEESYTWTILKPSNFNKNVNLGWRYEKTELTKMRTAGKR